ncbi:sigma factor-like helix-turn-helix DNA-binding protein [Actinopolymorpha pittospori]
MDAYVRRVLINEHHSWWRRAWRRAERSTDSLPERPGAADSRLEERDEMWELVQTLPPRQRAVVVLRFYEDLSPTRDRRRAGLLRRDRRQPDQPRARRPAGAVRAVPRRLQDHPRSRRIRTRER